MGVKIAPYNIGGVKTVCAVKITYILKLKHFYSITRSIKKRFEPGLPSQAIGLADYRYIAKLIGRNLSEYYLLVA